MIPFDFVNEITQGKKDLIRSSELPSVAEKDYVPFVVSKALSYQPDLILIINELNVRGSKIHGIDNLRHHDFLINTVVKRKRYGQKWVKPELTERVSTVMKVYGYSKEKALEVVGIFTEEQMKIMLASIAEGGQTKKSK